VFDSFFELTSPYRNTGFQEQAAHAEASKVEVETIRKFRIV
jgi:hypothetical protein